MTRTGYAPEIEYHIDRPFHNRTFPAQHAAGIVHDQTGENAIKIAFALDIHQRLADVAFRSYGHRLLVACGSVLTEALRGQTLRFARRVTADELATHFRLHTDERWIASMTVRALQRALSFSNRHPQIPVVNAASEPRRAQFVMPSLLLEDRKLIQPGQTLDGLRHDRWVLWHALMNFDLCLQVLTASRGLAVLEAPHHAKLLSLLSAAVPRLPASDRQLVEQVGVRGETPRAVARDRGVSEHEVLSEFWEIARRVQVLRSLREVHA